MATAVRSKTCHCGGCHAGLDPFTLDHFRAWALGVVLDNDEQWELDPFEEAFAQDVFTGIPVCWLVVPEENGKTTFAGGLALYHIDHRTSAYVPVAASARDQAEWIYRQAEGFVVRSDLEERFKCLEGYRRIRCDALGSRIQVFAADDRSGDGIIPTLAILDELHRHKDLALYRTWVGKLRKRGAQLIVISTAGEVGAEFELEREAIRQSATSRDQDGCFLRAEVVHEGRTLTVLHEYAVPEDGDMDDLELVKAANPASRVTVETLREKRVMTPSLQHWGRFTCNRSSRGNDAAIQESEWFAAASQKKIPKGEPIWLGLDVAWKHDTTAAVPLWWRDEHFRLFGPAVILEPPRDGTSLDPHLVEAALLGLHERNPLHTVVMDTSRAEQLAAWIEETFGARVIDRSQTNSFAVMDYDRFMEGLRMGHLKHSGDQGLTTHALNAVARLLPQGDVRFERPHSSRKGPEQARRVIDALTAASMVHATAVAELAAEEQWEPMAATA